MMLELTAYVKPTTNQDTVRAGLTSLLKEADRISSSKQQPSSKIIGDWQSTETMYSVVNRAQFNQWRENVNNFLMHNFDDGPALCFGFNEVCRFPQYMEFLEGQKFLNTLSFSLN
jgi:hypothetical protein